MDRPVDKSAIATIDSDWLCENHNMLWLSSVEPTAQATTTLMALSTRFSLYTSYAYTSLAG